MLAPENLSLEGTPGLGRLSLRFVTANSFVEFFCVLACYLEEFEGTGSAFRVGFGAVKSEFCKLIGVGKVIKSVPHGQLEQTKDFRVVTRYGYTQELQHDATERVNIRVRSGGGVRSLILVAANSIIDLRSGVTRSAVRPIMAFQALNGLSQAFGFRNTVGKAIVPDLEGGIELLVLAFRIRKENYEDTEQMSIGSMVV